MPLGYLYDAFNTQRNVLANPGEWDDPYENFILRSKVRISSGEIIEFQLHQAVYGQCWSFHHVSDAMWRLYSDGGGVRIKTTPYKLFKSLYHANIHKPDMTCGIGKVRYLPQTELMKIANHTYRGASLSSENLFHSLLVKRLAFRHEREVRLFYFDMENLEDGRLFSYVSDPHELISQIMLDPRTSVADAEKQKSEIRKKTQFRGDIKRSLLYAAPDFILDGGEK